MMNISQVRAQLTLPDVIGSGMVLQRGEKVPVWGSAEPGASIRVAFAGQEKKSVADSSGRWIVHLDPMPASAEPRTMQLSANQTIKLDSVLVGEVWLVTGQSNMQLVLDRTTKGDSVIASADYPKMKLFNVDRKVAFHHKEGKLAEWKPTTPQSVKSFSAAGYYFGLDLMKKLDVPVGIINSSFGGSQVEAWTPVNYLMQSKELRPCVERTKIWARNRPRIADEYQAALDDWKAAAQKAKEQGTRAPRMPHPPDALRDYRIAGSIYENMIHPLMPYKIKGAFWYQGESNEQRAEQYGLLLPVMIRSWREQWDIGNFPMGVVQLPNYRDPVDYPADQAWSHLREAQRRTAKKMPHTGLIVTIDIGEAHNIHPHDKADVGLRMSHWALATVYDKNMPATGPMMDTVEVQGSKMVVTFDEAGEGLTTTDGEAPHTFAIAGPDRHWYWAEAKIAGQNRVEVWSDKVEHPVAVRYAFNNNPRNPNLTNETGLPAAPFRSDDWPGPTHGRR